MVKIEAQELPVLSELLMDLLVCPACKGDLVQLSRGVKPTLNCPTCRLTYPIVGGIPVMLIDQASPSE